MSRLTTLAICTIAVAVLLPAPGAMAAPADDAREVFADWQPDQVITTCRFSREQLGNTLSVLGGVDLNYYAPGFREAVTREMARLDAGGCIGIVPDTPATAAARARSILRRLQITRIRPKGRLKESITIRNPGTAAVGLKGATLRDRSGRRVKLGSGRLGARRSLRVTTGCAKRRKKAYRRGSRLYACQRRRVWDDGGDVVKIADRRGVVVSQRGYGRFRGVFRFP